MNSLGKMGEAAAAKYLRRHGYKILVTNFQSRFGEIDIIARQKDTLVFAEVKTRRADSMTSPAEAVTFTKQNKIKKASLFYLSSYDWEINVRYDVLEVIAVQKDVRKYKIRHIPNAFY